MPSSSLFVVVAVAVCSFYWIELLMTRTMMTMMRMMLMMEFVAAAAGVVIESDALPKGKG